MTFKVMIKVVHGVFRFFDVSYTSRAFSPPGLLVQESHLDWVTYTAKAGQKTAFFIVFSLSSSPHILLERARVTVCNLQTFIFKHFLVRFIKLAISKLFWYESYRRSKFHMRHAEICIWFWDNSKFEPFGFCLISARNIDHVSKFWNRLFLLVRKFWECSKFDSFSYRIQFFVRILGHIKITCI